MFEKVFVEEEYWNSKKVETILKKIGHDSPIKISKVDDHFGKFYKPYLQKRTNLNLYLGAKKGHIVKQAPPAYGQKGSLHYYFIHAFNCIYECKYCYLQGYFSSPDIVLFLNYEQIVAEIEQKILSHPKTPLWFHAGEFSDSLALSHLTNELDYYFPLFERYPHAFLELRTKSANYKKLLSLKPLNNVILSFSLSPAKHTKQIDLKTPSLKARLKAIKALQDYGYKIGLHFDPIIYTDDYIEIYSSLIQEIKNNHINMNMIEYISIGVVRFSQDVFRQFQMNYPESKILKNQFIKGEDKKMRLIKPLRLDILSNVQKLLSQEITDHEKIYVCME